MNKKHKGNKPFDYIRIRKGKSLFEKLIKKYNIEGLTFTDQMFALGEHLLSQNGIQKPEIEESLDGDHGFECNKLCKKARTCTSNAMFELGEIKATNCYVSKYPYEWTTPDGRTVKVCKYMVFPNGFPHDAENPYPKCVAKQKDITIQLPRDRIMRNPDVCWICYKAQKKAREEKLAKRVIKPSYGRREKGYMGEGYSELGYY